MADDANTTDLRSRVINWALQQSFPAVMLLVQTAVIGWLGHYAIDTAIPAHLRAIQAGYDRQEAAHERAVQKMAETLDRDRELLLTSLRQITEEQRALR